MRLLLIGLLIQSTTLLKAQETQFNPNRKYHPDSLKNWTTSIMEEVSKKHPGFYRYTTRQTFDHLIDSTKQSIHDSLTELDYYRKLKPLIAQIGCMHTGISLSKSYLDYLDNTPTLIPLEIFIDAERKVFISKSYDVTQDIPIGGEILFINNQSMVEILVRLLKAIPADGYNQTEKILLMNYRFAFWYQSMIEVTQDFKVEIRTNGNTKTHLLKGVVKDVFPTLESLERNYENALEFEIFHEVGVLKIHSFAKTAIQRSGQDFKKFIRAMFEKMENAKIQQLIIDLRMNSGGTDGNAAWLASWFFDEPFRYWEKIEVTEAIAKEIKGSNRFFYKKPKEVDGSYRWKKTWLTHEFDYYETQKPAKKNFKGKTYIITNGLCTSSCADFVAVLSHNKKATIVGQETGGGFQGNTSGMMPQTTIQTGLRITIPLQKYTNAVDLTKNFGRGTIPDKEIVLTFDQWIHQKDVEMEYLFKLLQ